MGAYSRQIGDNQQVQGTGVVTTLLKESTFPGQHSTEAACCLPPACQLLQARLDDRHGRALVKVDADLWHRACQQLDLCGKATRGCVHAEPEVGVHAPHCLLCTARHAQRTFTMLSWRLSCCWRKCWRPFSLFLRLQSPARPESWHRTGGQKCSKLRTIKQHSQPDRSKNICDRAEQGDPQKGGRATCTTILSKQAQLTYFFKPAPWMNRPQSVVYSSVSCARAVRTTLFSCGAAGTWQAS